MRSARIIILWVVIGLIIGFLIWYLPPKLRPKYTAQTFIRVLPGFEKGSAVALIKHTNTLESLTDRDEIQKTDWFKRLGKTKDDRLAQAVVDLQKRLKALDVPDSDLISVSMTCRDGQEAALVLDEMVETFLKDQRAVKKKETVDKLSQIQTRQLSVQRDLDLAEQECDNVRRRYGFTDLEEHEYPDVRLTRLMDLQKRADNCAIEISEIKFLIEDINEQAQPSSNEKTEIKPSAEVKELRAKLRVLESRFKELQRMREAAGRENAEFNLAKAQYGARQKIRDERWRALDSIKTRVEELKILYDNPDASGLQFVNDATAPRQTDRRSWQAVIPPAGLAAVIAGIIQVILRRRAGGG